MVRTIFGLAKKSSVLVLLAGLAACQAADGTTQAPDVALVNSVMKGLGAVDPNEKPIDYKPRAPLAMPSEPAKLPEPETNVAGVNDANWPKQQDNEQLKELKDLYAGSSRMQREPLTPEQMRGFTVTGVTGQNRDLAAERRENEITEGEKLTRQEQRDEWERLQKLKAQQAGLDKNGLATRRYLTEPPTDYSTPSPDAPMPDVVQKNKRKPTNFDKYDSAPIDPRCLEGDSSYCN
ncbi:hypothetical protein K1718_22960 [Roseibium porphyridii]|uniref:DUF3035 domain-containing protein n=1 Tax=Roseibium porphyridii TaxID=2866279 RepID=A0ABY8F0P5_9HYPH|nr:hypothetical protein [Roseibium sp. KMA01]WFE88990.1 hypothetical protein K1718_22960 [Roseibium sp. KMA01]